MLLLGERRGHGNQEESVHLWHRNVFTCSFFKQSGFEDIVTNSQADLGFLGPKAYTIQEEVVCGDLFQGNDTKLSNSGNVTKTYDLRVTLLGSHRALPDLEVEQRKPH